MKLPRPPDPAELQFPSEHDRLLDTAAVLWRVHRTSGENVVACDRLRHWGPSTTMRFDLHEPPPPGRGSAGVGLRDDLQHRAG